MKLLLDTHIFLWLIENNPRLSAKIRHEITQGKHEVFLSAASNWECTIKHQLGKLDFPQSPDIYIPKQRKQHLINSLAIDENTISHLVTLPPLHKDPFDRLLICHSLQYNLIIVTEDNAILSYPNLLFLNQ